MSPQYTPTSGDSPFSAWGLDGRASTPSANNEVQDAEQHTQITHKTKTF